MNVFLYLLAEVRLLPQDHKADLWRMYPVLLRELLHLFPRHLCAPGWCGDEARRLAVRRVRHLSQAQAGQCKGTKRTHLNSSFKLFMLMSTLLLLISFNNYLRDID